MFEPRLTTDTEEFTDELSDDALDREQLPAAVSSNGCGIPNTSSW